MTHAAGRAHFYKTPSKPARMHSPRDFHIPRSLTNFASVIPDFPTNATRIPSVKDAFLPAED